MTDRELLELAAKAAGIELVWHGDADPWCFAETVAGIKWNPRDDDGDALRLAVKLDFAVVLEGSKNNVRIDGASPNGLELVNEPLGEDPYAATRRAIVRAAAEIGRNMT